MASSWWFDTHSEGYLTFRRMQTDMAAIPGEMVQPPVNSGLCQITLSWRPAEDDNLLQFVVETMDDIDPKSGAIIGPSQSIAGRISFRVTRSNGALQEIIPGELPADLLLSIAARQEQNGKSEPIAAITAQLRKDALIAAQEMAHDIWDDIGVSMRHLESHASYTPHPIQLKGELAISHKSEVFRNAGAQFMEELVRKGIEMQRESKKSTIYSHSELEIPSSSSPRYESSRAGGEVTKRNKRDTSVPSMQENVLSDANSPLSFASRSQRGIHYLVKSCRGIPEDVIDQCVQGLAAMIDEVDLEGGEERISFEVCTTARRHNPLRIRTRRLRRCAYSYFQAYCVTTCMSCSTVWILQSNTTKSTVFVNESFFQNELDQYSKFVDMHKAELIEHNIPKMLNEDADPDLIEIAFQVCKHPTRNGLTVQDVENALVRANLIDRNEPDSETHRKWIEIIRQFDFDGTGFMEYNEFFLFCQHLTAVQLRLLTIYSAVGLVQWAGTWRRAMIDADLVRGVLSFYSDKEAFKKLPTERMTLHRKRDFYSDQNDIWDFNHRMQVLCDIVDDRTIITLAYQGHAVLWFIVSDSDASRLLSALLTIQAMWRARETGIHLPPVQILQALALTATQCFL